jgi:hypothetical protein
MLNARHGQAMVARDDFAPLKRAIRVGWFQRLAAGMSSSRRVRRGGASNCTRPAVVKSASAVALRAMADGMADRDGGEWARALPGQCAVPLAVVKSTMAGKEAGAPGEARLYNHAFYP